MVCGNRARDVNTKPRDDQRFTLVPIPKREEERDKVKERDPCTMVTEILLNRSVDNRSTGSQVVSR